MSGRLSCQLPLRTLGRALAAVRFVLGAGILWGAGPAPQGPVQETRQTNRIVGQKTPLRVRTAGSPADERL